MEEDRLRKYEPLWNSWYIDGLIGTGSFGSVYKIKREEFGITQYSALKIISIPSEEAEIKKFMAEGMTNQETRSYYSGIVEDIYTEIALMSQLKGKSNIVSYEDHQTIERKDQIGFDIFIRMELLKGLRDYVIEHTMTKKEIVKLGIDICKALVLCQKYNILHRDIKPDNIFISKDGDFKLGDFGIARKVENYQMGLSIKGSYEYMAPEVYQGKAYDTRVDIYSLGIVLYTYLNHSKTPFLNQGGQVSTYSERQEALKRRLQGEEIPAPVNASGALAEVILKAIKYNQEERYDNASEFLEALLKLKDSELIEENIDHEPDLEATVVLNSQKEYIPERSESDATRILSSTNPTDNNFNIRESKELEETLYLDKRDMPEQSILSQPLSFHYDEAKKNTYQTDEKQKDIADFGTKSNKKITYIVGICLGVGIICSMAGIVITNAVSHNQKKVQEEFNSVKQVNAFIDTVKSHLEMKQILESQVEKEFQYNGDGKEIDAIENIKALNEVESKNVTSISLQNNKIKTLSGIEKFFNLSELNLSCNKVNNIDNLKNNKKIQSIVIDNNEIEDISALSDMILLEELNLARNQVSDLTALKNDKALKNLDLSRNKDISDIAMLSNLKQLEFIGLEGTSVTENDVKNLKKKLPNCCIIWDGGVE